MQYTLEDQSAVKKKITVEIPTTAVTRELDNAYKELKKTAKIKGFRPGKAPRSVLERLYGKEVRADVSARLIQENLLEALKETKLNVVGSPQVDPPELNIEKPYVFIADVEVQPDLEPFDVKGLTLKKTVYQVTDEEMTAQLEMLRKNLAKLEKIDEDRPVAQDDFLMIDYEGLKDGKPYAETQMTENFTLKVGDGRIHSTFDEQLIGMKMGEEKVIPVSFPEDYSNDKLAGLAIEFAVTLKEIRKQVLPEVDDAMAKELGPFESLDDLKAKIRENLENGYAKRVEQELNEQIYTQLLDQQEFEVPNALVDYELQGIVSEAEQTFAYHNVSMEEAGVTTESLSEKYRDVAVKQVKRHLILSKVIEQEKLTLADEALESGFQEMADSFRQPVDMVKGFYAQNPERLDVFKHTLLEKQAIKLIIDGSHIEAVEPELDTGADATDQQ